MEVSCTPGCFVKSPTGTIHRSNSYGSIDLHRIDYYIKERYLSKAIQHKDVAHFFGVDKSTITSHNQGVITEDSLLKIMVYGSHQRI